MSRSAFVVPMAVLMAACGVAAQESKTPKLAEEWAIRQVVERYQRAMRQADVAAVKAVTTPGAVGVSPGSTGGAELTTTRVANAWKERASLLRRVDLLMPAVAVATGVWRSFDLPAPFDTGTFQYTLLRGEDGWKVAHTHEAFLPGPPEHRVASKEADRPAGADPNGWITLFDGRNLDAWVAAAAGVEIGSAWRVANGELIAIPERARSGLLTRTRYRFFELEFEWLAAPGSNSGVKYRLLAFDRLGGRSAEPLGPEYQIADDDGDAGAKVDARQRSGALYAAIPVERPAARPLGQWNQGRIVVQADHVEHWLNGTLTARYETDIPFASAIAIQHHTTEVRFRNIRIRPL